MFLLGIWLVRHCWVGVGGLLADRHVWELLEFVAGVLVYRSELSQEFPVGQSDPPATIHPYLILPVWQHLYHNPSL